MSKEKFQLPETLREENDYTSIWVKPIDYSKTSSVVNLAPGIPNFLPPREFVECLRDVLASDDPGVHQYSRSMGSDCLVNIVAQMYSPAFGRDIDPMKEVIVTIGAKEALGLALIGLLNPGDEVIVIEPFFTLYQLAITSTGGTCVFLPLRRRPTDGKNESSSADWTLDPEELKSKFTSRTKLILLNTPNNPLGKMFNRDELTQIADLCKKHDVVCIADEVYEWLVYDGGSHIKMASLPGMWERTITLSSAGKMFSATGWRIGWAIGPARLLGMMQAAHKAGTLMNATPMQIGVARCLELEFARTGQPESYRSSLCADAELNRDKLTAALSSAGLHPIIPQGGYFLVADISSLAAHVPSDVESPLQDGALIEWLAHKKGLIVIPLAGFYSTKNVHLGKGLVRLCMVKDKTTIDQAVENIRNISVARLDNGTSEHKAS